MKHLLLLVKITLTVGALAYVLTQIDLAQLQSYLQRTNLLYLFLALALLNTGQLVSAFRLRFYLSQNHVIMKRTVAIGVYYVGMLLNLILPGGIGGDGYKAWFIRKHYGMKLTTAIRILLSARGNGLLLLFLYTFVLIAFSPTLMALPYATLLLPAAAVITVIGYTILAGWMLKEKVETQLGASIYSLIVQGMVMLTAWALLGAIGYPGDTVPYLILFMVSSIVSILPISIGGVGLRELTFFYGAGWMALDTELGITLSFLYFAVNLLASLLGLIAFYRMGNTRKELEEASSL